MTFDRSQHLAWGDVSVDDLENPTLLRLHLKRSKCDQLSKGIDVFIGCAEDSHLCPVTACLLYMYMAY